ncbi:MAG: metallophosphoesterase family protein [Peptococcaceae bacterium]|nr:metallophosphoesterase family protein [Peptococcaceae bacterium]
METVKAKTAGQTAGILTGLRGKFHYLAALAGALVLISLLGHQNFQVEAFKVRLSVRPATAGYTVVEIPPLAAVKAHTHATPLRITVRLESIDLQSAQKMLDQKQSRATLVNSITGGLRAAAVLFVLKILFLSAAGGAFAVFLRWRKPYTRLLQGALGAALAVGILLMGTCLTYDAGKFENPELDGALKMAPWAIGLAGQALDKIDTLSGKMEMVADNVHQLLSQIDRLQPFSGDREGLVRVLHVSDIHNNPAALVYIQRIAGLFRVDLIIDTGDITDYGTPLENLLLERLAGLKIPYVFIPGNHDSPETIKKMRSIPGVAVLDGSAVTVKGLRIMGFADPASATGDVEPPPVHMIPQYAGQIEKALAGQPGRPDILAVHNHRIARMLAGKAPVILHGHDHKLSVEEDAGSIFIDPGSSGAAGLRRLQGDRTPYSVVIQYYAPAGDGMKLLAADSITVKNLDSGFHVDRRVFNAKTGG